MINLHDELERLTWMCAQGIGWNECELARSVPFLLNRLRITIDALEFYADKNGGPYAPGDHHSVDGGKRALEALAKIESWG